MIFRKTLLFVILFIIQKSWGTSTIDSNQMQNNGANSVETKPPTVPNMNISVNQLSGNFSESSYNVRPGFSKVLDFYNSELLAVNWIGIKSSLSEGCQKDVEAYIQGLSKAENWALKMEDASGRYSTGWFWGNMYWVGSQNLCEHITPKKRVVINSQNYSRITRAVSQSTPIPDNEGLSVPMGYKPGPVYENGPPFPVSFFTLRLHLNSSFTSEEKILHVGICLPHACSRSDVHNIMEKTASTSKYITVNVESVKSTHNRYNAWGDSTFIVLIIITSIMIFLLAAGTGFDYYLESLKKAKMMPKSYTHYNATLEMNVPDTKSGKVGLYVVNNNNNNNNTNDSTCNNSDEHLHTLDVTTGNKNTSRSRESVCRLVLREMLLSFSIRGNMQHICDKTVGSDTLPVLHGLKAISMAWVILGHTCIVAFKYSDNMEYRKVVQKEFMFQTISNGTFSVDTFFFVSGLLVSFLYFRTNAKGKLDPLNKGNSFVAGSLHFLGLIGYRFARLTVPYLYTVGLVEVSMKWFYYNSVFEPPTNDHVNCPNYWWRNLLYINTLFPVDQMCMLWSWYLSDDTQFYVVGAVLLILAASHFKSAAALLTTFMLSSWATTFYIAYVNSHMPGSDDPLALFDKIYDKPWTRLGPYLIGMCTGWLLFKKNCRIQMSKLGIVSGWLSAVAVLLALVYGLYEAQLSPWMGAAYSALSHSAWALGLSWIVIACVTGYGGVVNKILSATFLYPFSRVTYCAYLIHPIVIRAMVMSMDSPLHLGSIVTVIIFLGQFVASYFLAFFVSLAFEAPMVSLLRIISKVVAHKKNQTGQTTT